MQRGQFWYGDKIHIMKGDPGECHRNSSLIWKRNKNSIRLVTGYALSDDGMWRQHSWCIWIKPRVNRVIETTAKRIAYFGFVMTLAECERFLREQEYM